MADSDRFGYRPGLDGLRGVAVLAVMLFHAAPGTVKGGFLGVDVFFVLSGFLITSLLLGEWGRTRAIDIVGFYLRRGLRLLPALMIFLCAVAGFVLIVEPTLASTTMRWIPLVYATNTMLAFDLGSVTFGHLWTLAAEEQFYCLWPPILLGLLAAKLPRRVIVAVTGTAAAASLLAGAVLWAHGVAWTRIYYGPDTHAAPILVGCLLGELWMWRMIPRLRHVAGVSVAALAVLAAFALRADPTIGMLYQGGYAVVAVAAALVVLGILRCPTLAARFEGRALVRTGRLSYALYLWHPLLLELVGTGPLRFLAIALAFPVAAASMRLVEAPFLALKHRLARSEPGREGTPPALDGRGRGIVPVAVS